MGRKRDGPRMTCGLVSSGAYLLRSTTGASYRSTAGACILLRSTTGASPLHASFEYVLPRALGVIVTKEASARQPTIAMSSFRTSDTTDFETQQVMARLAAIDENDDQRDGGDDGNKQGRKRKLISLVDSEEDSMLK
ncbi:hypothetical protein Bca52824_052629 [Brassica carinata]|uniref:Uncharacterized protein n=1 Tax=Brassica carinata TaxID=52824 RepID=A0A8X7RA63_BRACI|nr:hypothetical protein Bca52824_052629 [Brassica carinata]